MTESILIVDDEPSVRQTFAEWLQYSGIDCNVHAVADAASALQFADQSPIDLAILDWNLGSGSDGLQLLQDLVEFHPDLVAILVTGFAHRATPLDALRMGVRDYLEKSAELSREVFLNSVQRQLEKIIPAKRQREFYSKLRLFRESVEKILPLVQTAAALQDPVPMPEAIHDLFRFILETTQATQGVLLVHQFRDDGSEQISCFDAAGKPLEGMPTIPFARSLAATVVSMQQPWLSNDLHLAGVGPIDWYPFEQNRRHLLAVPMDLGDGIQVVIELLDKPPDGFSEADRRFLQVAADLGRELLRQALRERQAGQLFIDAVEGALEASDRVRDLRPSVASEAPDTPPPESVLNRLREGLQRQSDSGLDGPTAVRLAERIRVLALHHGPMATEYCLSMIEQLDLLLTRQFGSWDR